jgi:hypothetical protein
LIHIARRHLDAGAFEFCVLVSVVAAEIATQRFMVERWLAHGVSNKKLKDYETDYKFSMLLNVEIFLASPPDMKPDRRLIGQVNQARVMRNEYMHEGKRIKDKATAAGVLHNIVAYIEYIDQVRKALVADAKPNVEGGGES